MGQLFDVLPMWRNDAADVSGQVSPCSPFLEGEVPDGLLAGLTPFLQAG